MDVCDVAVELAAGEVVLRTCGEEVRLTGAVRHEKT